MFFDVLPVLAPFVPARTHGLGGGFRAFQAGGDLVVDDPVLTVGAAAQNDGFRPHFGLDPGKQLLCCGSGKCLDLHVLSF